MKNMERPVEKRSHNRLQVKDGVYAIIHYKPAIFAQIINISKDGMAVCYSSNGQQLNVPSELDVFIMDSNFYIDKSPFSSHKNRQRCFQFGKMKSSQHFQLDYLIQNYTKEGCSDKEYRQSGDHPI